MFADLNRARFSYEIFIVDNGSQDKTTQIIQSFKNKYPDATIPILLETNAGTTYSLNLALRKARGRYIGIMDSDVEISEGTIGLLIHTLEADKNAGLVAPRLVYPNDSLQKSTDVLPTIFTKFFRYFFLKSIEKKEVTQEHGADLREVDYAISAMWALRSEILEKVGILDENIFYAPEDVDYCLRVWQSGYRVLYDPKVTVVHHAQEISRGLRINKATISHIKGLCYYFRKHRYLFKKPILRKDEK